MNVHNYFLRQTPGERNAEPMSIQDAFQKSCQGPLLPINSLQSYMCTYTHIPTNTSVYMPMNIIYMYLHTDTFFM